MNPGHYQVYANQKTQFKKTQQERAECMVSASLDALVDIVYIIPSFVRQDPETRKKFVMRIRDVENALHNLKADIKAAK